MTEALTVLSPATQRWVGDVLLHKGWFTPVPLASRSDNRVFRVGADGVSYALKFVAPGRVAAFAHERAITDYLAAHGLPVPRVIAAEELPDADTNGDGKRLVTLRAWLPGEPVGVFDASIPVATLNVRVDVFAATLARVHRLPLDEVRDFWQYPEDRTDTAADWATNFVQKKIAGDLARVAPVLPGDLRVPLTDELTAWGHWLADAPVPLAPLHGDYYGDNVLIEGGVVTGLLDWEAARVGDPLWDLARTEAAAFAAAPDAWTRFRAAYAARVPWAVDTARIRRYRLLMALGDLRYAVRHAPDLIPARVPAVVHLWQQCMEGEGD